MIGRIASDQGRARGLYDEQLQRKLQEKRLSRQAPADPPALFGRGRPTDAAGEI